MRTNVRRPLFGGMREIHAIWFDIGLIGEQEARRRVLAHWQAGARLHAAAGGYLLTLARPMLADCSVLDGLALCRIDGVLSSAPLASDERHAAPHGSCWLVRGAQAHAVTLADADLVDAAAWIDLGAIVVHVPLVPPAGKAFVALAAPEESQSLRGILDNVIAPPSQERDAFLRAALRQAPPGIGGKAAVAAMMVAGATLGAIGFLPLLLGRLLAKGTGGAGGAGSGGTGAGTAAQRPGPDPAWLQRLNGALARMATLTKVSSLIGWRHAAYLRKMVDMFEKGDVAEALRHAIPLGGQPDSMRQALGALRARASLDINTPGGTTSVIGLDPSLQHYLREKYRKLFQRLEREGRIDEATFVLAELLNSGVEAVDYLERNGRLRQAAQLAEKLALAPEIAVRLWILAGDATRAVRIARMSGAFGDTVRLLERKQDAQAGPLRVLWAEYLAERGDLSEAADVIWPLEAYRSVALAWLLQAEQAGRVPGVRALVRRLALMPDSLADSVARINALLDQPGEEGAALRAALAIELLALDKHSAATKRLAGEVLRYVIPERAAAMNQLSKAELKKLISIADAGMLKSDMPTIGFSGDAGKSKPLGQDGAPLVASAGERGLLQIHDARRLPDGHYLLALGEAGVIRVNATGKQLVHFALPAYHLVLATNGERALALARRGDVVRASRIDLTACKVSDWLSHPIDFWASQYDGVVWNAVIDNRIVAIDTSKDQLSVIWQVADLPGKVFDFLDDGNVQVILMSSDQELQQWRYSLPARRLMARESFTYPTADVTHMLGHAINQTPLLLRHKEHGSADMLQVEAWNGRLFNVEHGDILGPPKSEIQDGWLLVQTRTGDSGYRCLVGDQALHKVVADLRMPNASEPGIRAHGKHILMFDRAGRLLDVDCLTGALRTLSLS